MEGYEKRFDAVLSRIEAARLTVNEHQIVKIVAASKYVTPLEIEALYRVGQRAFGENKVQDLSIKCESLASLPLEWHFIGRLQTNKINALLDLSPALIHSCEDYEMALEIDKRAEIKGVKPSILLQINSAHEASKAGVDPDHAMDTYLKIHENLKNVTLKGVMSIGAHVEDAKIIQKSFETTYGIYEKLIPYGAKYCSMGMSGDFELAIACGSNMLRLGSVLFPT